MKFLEFQPGSALRQHILQYIFIEEFTEEAKSYLLPPNGIPGLVIQYKDTKSSLIINEEVELPSTRAFVVGIYKNRLTRVHRGDVGVMGIMFQPTSVYHLFHQSCLIFSENVVTDLKKVVGNKYDSILDKIIEEADYESKIKIFEDFILQEFSLMQPKFNMIDDISKEILFTNGLIKIPDLLNKYKISRRWMEKGFAERVGVSPKYYLDLIRFNHVIRLLRNSPKQDWGQIIFDCGFYDHPHLIRQFKKFTNASPKLLMEQENELMEYLLGKY